MKTIDKLRLTTREQRKMLVSVVGALLTRLPGAVGLLWFLPLLNERVGTVGYTDILSALALAGPGSFLIGGLATVCRRMVGEAYGNQNRAAEADGFVTVVASGLLATVLSVAAVIGYCRLGAESTAFSIIATVSVVGAYIALSESAWTAYNQYYVVSTLLIVLQTIGFTIGLTIPAVSANILAGAAVLLAPYILTSVFATVLLLSTKPYLLKGRAVAVGSALGQGWMLAMADGFMLASLGIAVVWMQSEASPAESAWFATLVRLFQTFLVPVIMLLVPLSSYIRYRWNQKSMAQQHAYTKLALSIGLAYGVIVALALLLLSRLYVGYLLHLPVPNDLAIFALFCVIVAYKSYSSIVYVVLVDETKALSIWTTTAVTIAMAVGGIAALLGQDPLAVIDLYAVVSSVLMLGVLWRSVNRFVSATKPSVIGELG